LPQTERTLQPANKVLLEAFAFGWVAISVVVFVVLVIAGIFSLFT
jgi:hypothetical protein